MSNQAAFANALLDPQHICPAGVFSVNGADPASRFAVYRNNVLNSLINALADSYPVVVQLVGEVFFKAMALMYVQANPPRSPLLVNYGEDFPGFIQAFEPASSLPYLTDVARLERRRVQAYHAGDCNPVSHAAMTALLSRPKQLSGLRLDLHPSLSVLASHYPVLSLWAAHQGLGELEQIDLRQPEHMLILRHALEVEVVPLDPGASAFIGAVQAGLPLSLAAAQGLQAAAGFNLGQCLALLIGKAVITHLHPQEEA